MTTEDIAIMVTGNVICFILGWWARQKYVDIKKS